MANQTLSTVELVNRQREYFHSGITLDIGFRKSMLQTLAQAIRKEEEALLNALYADLKKHPLEAYSNEIGLVLAELKHALKNLKRWTKARRVPTDLHLLPGHSYRMPTPYGVSLIMGPWNYPFQLLFAPLIGAIAAGNTSVLKPSELAPATEEVIQRIISEHFNPEYIAVVTGGPSIATELLAQEWDYICFTGSTKVGTIVAKAAAEKLIPYTLELGGKSPTFVDPSADLDIAAKRIAFAKFNNAGQTCVAPDYLLVHHSIKDELIDKLKGAIETFYGSNPQESEYFGRIINQGHFSRLRTYMDSGELCSGGALDPDSRYIAPTILDRVSWDSPVMADEIFGPILPVLSYQDLDEAITAVRSRPKPLALYVYANDKKVIERVTSSISFGGGGINTSVVHVSSKHLPFGGVGPSGTGAYHGKASFDTFTHYTSMLKQPGRFDLGLAYPGKASMKMIKRIMG